MVFLIQNTQNRDTEALHLKLDELIRVTKGARDSAMALEDKSEEELDAAKAELLKKPRAPRRRRGKGRGTRLRDPPANRPRSRSNPDKASAATASARRRNALGDEPRLRHNHCAAGRGTALTEQRPPRVFISYSHDSEEHAARVLRLANDLRRDGIEAILDQYVTSPPEGWPRWMDSHVRDDDFVVMVCTETYYRSVIGKETPGTGLGVRWEGYLICNHLYESDLTRFVPVLMDGGKRADIPEALRSASYYFIDQSGGYEGLLRRLFNRPAAEMPPIGERPALPVLAPQWTERPLGRLHNVPELPPNFGAPAH